MILTRLLGSVASVVAVCVSVQTAHSARPVEEALIQGKSIEGSEEGGPPDPEDDPDAPAPSDAANDDKTQQCCCRSQYIDIQNLANGKIYPAHSSTGFSNLNDNMRKQACDSADPNVYWGEIGKQLIKPPEFSKGSLHYTKIWEESKGGCNVKVMFCGRATCPWYKRLSTKLNWNDDSKCSCDNIRAGCQQV
eukprot:TRINITY_DN96750_c0_g1_i1.p1 TRINITY_DN96750_c0_g1~~TRINITY_DN96750_c0_g1_i1.p1  ORF type:complete len:212 (-),score=25.27 TRINITY_DN96750_c0_g1_i1:37-612(-)